MMHVIKGCRIEREDGVEYLVILCVNYDSQLAIDDFYGLLKDRMKFPIVLFWQSPQGPSLSGDLESVRHLNRKAIGELVWENIQVQL